MKYCTVSKSIKHLVPWPGIYSALHWPWMVSSCLGENNPTQIDVVCRRGVPRNVWAL